MKPATNDNRYFTKHFVIALIISAAIIFSTLLLASFQGYAVSQTEADDIAAEIENLAETATWTDIFLNNFLLTLVAFVPIVGIAFEVYVQYNTGYVLGALAKAYDITNTQVILLIFFASPVGILEYVSYVFALAESIILVNAAYRKQLKQRLVTQTWKTILLAAVLLLSGALIEAALLGNL